MSRDREDDTTVKIDGKDTLWCVLYTWIIRIQIIMLMGRFFLDTLEMLLLLLWRHLEYYADPKNVNDRPLRTTSVMRLPVTSNQAQFHEEVKKRLDPLLQRISSLEFVSPSTYIYLTFF